MTEDGRIEKRNPTHEQRKVESLVRRLTEAENELQTLVEGQVDAVVNPDEHTPIMLRQAQYALQQSEARYRRLITRMSAIVFELEPDGKTLVVNEAITPLTGYKPQELEGRNWWDIFFPGSQRQQVDELYRRFRSGDVSNYELELAAKNGSILNIELNSANYYDEDGVLDKIVGFGVNVSQRKRAEKTLLNSEERFRLVVASVKDYAIFTLNPSGVITSWNYGAEKIKGYKAEEIIGQHFSCFYSKGDIAAGKPKNALAIAASKGRFEDENWRIRKDGSRFWGNIIITPLHDDKGNHVGFTKVVRDMTHRKQAEAELQRQTNILRLLQEVATAANEADTVEYALRYSVDRICETMGWNIGHVYRLSENSSDELVSTNIWHIEPPGRFEEFRTASANTSFKKGTGLPGMAYDCGEPVWISDVPKHEKFTRTYQALQSGVKMGLAFPIVTGKQVIGVMEFFADEAAEPDKSVLEVMENIGTQLGRVFERKQSEEALRQSESRFRAIFQRAALGIELIDLDGHILETNDAVTSMLGYEAEELRHLTFADIKHPANTIANVELFQELRTGKRDSYRMEKPFVRKDGRLSWGRVYVSLVRGQNGQPQFAVGMLEDITERKQLEAELAELQRRLMEGSEIERLQLARELHDGPVQDLYGVSFMLKAYSEGLPAEVNTKSLDGLNVMLNQVIGTLRRICGELRPPALAPFGLEKAIRSHTEAFQETHPEVHMKLNLMADEQLLPEQTRLALFRIYQQLLTNVAFHAKATSITISFSVDAEEAVLEILDNGSGFMMPARWIELARKGHLGLVSARERAQAIGGTLVVETAPGKGTQVSVRVPYSNTSAD